MEIEAAANEFTELGGRYAFGILGGGHSLKMADALERNGVTFLTTGHETTGALMAAAAARQSNSPALALSIKGPGFINMVPGLLSNAYEGFPHLSISEAYPPDGGQRRHKWLDHLAVAGEFLRDYNTLGSELGGIEKAWRSAQREFPGPVHLELLSEPVCQTDKPQTTINTNVDSLFSKIEAAAQPAMIVGSVIGRLNEVVQAALLDLRIPVFTTPAAKGCIPENLPFAAGVYTGEGKTLVANLP